MVDPRMQGLDPRMRALIQQQRLLQQGSSVAQQLFTNGAVRFSQGIVRPVVNTEQYEQLLQRQQFQPRGADPQIGVRLPVNQVGNISRPQLNQTNPTVTNNSENTNTEEIPDNVTAELEKLEQESGTMAELQGVSEILGGLGDDDDELLGKLAVILQINFERFFISKLWNCTILSTAKSHTHRLD